jgi:hypothetical protein
VLTPEPFDERIAANRPVRMQEEQGQQRTEFRAAEQRVVREAVDLEGA